MTRVVSRGMLPDGHAHGCSDRRRHDCQSRPGGATQRRVEPLGVALDTGCSGRVKAVCEGHLTLQQPDCDDRCVSISDRSLEGLKSSPRGTRRSRRTRSEPGGFGGSTFFTSSADRGLHSCSVTVWQRLEQGWLERWPAVPCSTWQRSGSDGTVALHRVSRVHRSPLAIWLRSIVHGPAPQRQRACSHDAKLTVERHDCSGSLLLDGRRRRVHQTVIYRRRWYRNSRWLPNSKVQCPRLTVPQPLGVGLHRGRQRSDAVVLLF